MLKSNPEKSSWLDRPIFQGIPFFTGEMLLFIVIVGLAVFSRLYDLGLRVMSHDESLHVYYSWLLYQGQGYQHSPMMHGPLQFHLLALTYFLLGASDFTARLPHAIASILTIVMVWKWRRYLGRPGTLVAAALMLISPFMLYYGRYARNEAFVALFGLLTIYAILRYMETGKQRYLILLTIATVLHFTSKETAFIYTAQTLLFLAVYLINRVTRASWQRPGLQNAFIIALSISGMLLGATLGIGIYNRLQLAPDALQTAAPIVPEGTLVPAESAGIPLPSATALAAWTAMAVLAAVILLIIGYGWRNLRREHSFDMLVVLTSFVLPMLAPLAIAALGSSGWDPLAYQFSWPGWNLGEIFAQYPARTGAVLLGLTVLSITLGMFWDSKRWPIQAAIFWGIYIFFFTTFFTNPQGLATGLVGSLGYWLQQQGVHRGSQPWYYYLLIQIPIYEFLPALGLWLAVYLGIRRKSPHPLPSDPKAGAPQVKSGPQSDDEELSPDSALVFPLLLWWSLSSLVAFTLAGEKMPWLTVHITLPMILLSGWALGQLIERLDWTRVRERRGPFVAILTVIFCVSLPAAFAKALGANPPFQGKTLVDLTATGAFLLWAAAALVSAGGIAYLTSGWKNRDTLRLTTLAAFGLLALLTGRAAIRAAYVHYDDAREYLVYAHGAHGVRDVVDRLARISDRIAGGNNLAVAYDNGSDTRGVAWPFTWYLRDYPNKTPFDQPDPGLSSIPFIIVDPQNYASITQVVGDNYYEIDLLRMVWPNQDYFGLNWTRIRTAVADPGMRAAIFQIWLNRDYTLYGQATGAAGLTVSSWEPSDAMKLFIRKDYAARIWEFGVVQPAVIEPDPYEQGKIVLIADQQAGTSGSGPGQFSGPRGLAVAPDGSIFVADTNNSRIEHFAADGQFIDAWGTFADVSDGSAPLGSLNQPWDVAVSPDGLWVYVVDTWNHRVVKFSASGTPVTMWGSGRYDPLSNDPLGLWGPRGIAVDSRGFVFVADTGNKRILVFDPDGVPVTTIGNEGMDVGQFEEPVGIALDGLDNLYVADTWNQRIQVFTPDDDRQTYFPTLQWDVAGWYSESLDNKPYLAVDEQGNVFVTDPEAFRVIEFDAAGRFVRTWGDFGNDFGSFGLAAGVDVDAEGRVWVSDAANDWMLRFTLP